MKKIIIGAFLGCSFASLWGQQKSDTLPQMSIQEVEISTHSFLKRNISSIQPIQSIDAKKIEMSMSATTADALLLNTNAFIQKSQQGGGSITLRGFEASRVLLYIDGVRLNNLIYRSGHLQNIITLDPFALHEVNLHLGASSNLFGSDALGGVVSVTTLLPKFSMEKRFKWTGKISTTFQSVNQSTQNHFQISQFNQKWSFNTAVTWSDFGDLKSGRNHNPFYQQDYQLRPFSIVRNQGRDSIIPNANPYLQSGSAYSQFDFIEKIAFRKNEHILHQLNLQFSTSSNIPRYDRLTEMVQGTPKFAEWYYGPQVRSMLAYDRVRKNESAYFQTTHVGLNFQHVEESRFQRRFQSNNLDGRNENVNVWGMKAWAERKNGDQTTVVGGDVYLNFLESTANRTQLSSGNQFALDTRYPNGKNSMHQAGIYLENKYKWTPKVQTQWGGRLGYSRLSSELNDSIFFKFPFSSIQQNNLTYSGNVGLAYFSKGIEEVDQWKTTLFSSTGFRTPNIDDLGKIFETAKGNIIVPNEAIKPEKTWTTDLGFTRMSKQMVWETHAYATLFFDAIVTSPFQYQGKDSIVYDGVLSAVFANQNQRRAFVLGGNSQLSWRINPHLTWNIGANYTRGRIIVGDSTTPLDHIPPLQISSDINYHVGKIAIWGQFYYQGRKDIRDYLLNGEDNEQYAPATGMPAWMVVHLKCRVALVKGFVVQGGIENIFDTQYRVFASGINGAGRNFQISLRKSF